MDVSDAKQEQMFKEYDKDGSGSIDYDEFRHIWAMVANVRQELANRGLKFSKFVPTFVLREKLKKILDEEEDKESEALVHAEAWKEWQDALTEKKKLFAEARVIADNALALALDAGGQVYMFGAGTHGQFRGASFAHAFEQFAHVQETWEGRVAQDPKMATYLEEKQANQIRSGMESKPETTAPEVRGSNLLPSNMWSSFLCEGCCSALRRVGVECCAVRVCCARNRQRCGIILLAYAM